MDTAQSQLSQQSQPQPQPQQHNQPPQAPVRKRRKNEANNDDAAAPAEPRRLRRSHEACARCRSKKIKCDSKYPRCSACATAGTACHQEDRHRQTLITRGHTERVEQQLVQCDALLKRHIPGFDINNLDEILAREGIDANATANIASLFQFAQSNNARSFPLRTDTTSSVSQPPKPYYQPQQPHTPHLVHPGYPHPMALPYSAPPSGSPYPPHMQLPGPSGPYNPHIHPAFQHSAHPQMPAQSPMRSATPPSVSNDIKGQDPKSNDMSNAESLAKNFGVSSDIVSDLKLGPGAVDKEDLAVGSSGLTSGRDRDVAESSMPRNTSQWISVCMRRNHTVGNLYAVPMATNTSVNVWLPKDRTMVKRIVDIYFTRLNYHRPVFVHKEFLVALDSIYDGQVVQHDPGFVCSLYLILGLGTLSDLNHRVTQSEERPNISPDMVKKWMPPDWPEHDEFLERALAVKPDLRVTISSLQALILLHWYLYTERQGRTLWRLVGSLVRLSIELGLHHDPTAQQGTFTEEECQLRIKLWGIVMVHDRGTSILLGRPLAIAPSDSNTPRPTHSKSGLPDFSEHFLLSHPIAEIQADIINSLYTPTKQSGDALMRHATRIIKSMVEFRKRLPESYQYYFSGTDDWPLDRKTQLVQEITEDQGLTLLKVGISRILLLRALFNSKELTLAQRHKALVDAVTTSHNVIIVHHQLIRFPDIAFFTSPIPLHIAAMVILYGHISRCDHLPKQVALEDLWLALDMLPRLRWRWERKDLNGGHPLIEKLAERVMDVNLHQVGPTAHPILMSEREWDDASPLLSVPQKTQQSTSTMPHSFNGNGPPVYGQQSRSASMITNMGSDASSPPDKHLVEVPTGLFYPFYPESQVSVDRLNANHTVPPDGSANSGNTHAAGTDFTQLLATAVPPGGTYGCQPSQDSFMLEEKDPRSTTPGMQVWMNVPGQRGVPSYPIPHP